MGDRSKNFQDDGLLIFEHVTFLLLGINLVISDIYYMATKTFLYKAKNSKGLLITGTVKAADSAEAEKILQKNSLSLLDLIPEKAEINFSMPKIFNRVKARDKALFARQLATMISAGLTITKSIRVISTQTKKAYVHQIYMEIYRDLEEGLSFSAALSKHPDVFDQVFISIVSAGEATGKLDVVLAQLADQLENDNNFVGKVKGALYYPAFILLALVGIGSYMLVVVIPQLKSVFDSQGGQLPFATRALISLSGFVSKSWWLLLVMIVVLVVAVKFWVASPTGSRFWSLMKIKTPLFKNMAEGIYMYRFSRILAMLIGSGVPLLDALKICSGVMNNEIYEKSIVALAKQVEKGVPISVQMSKDTVFPSLIGQMAAVGEETGKLDEVMLKVADYFGESTDQNIKTISTLIEPIILVIMGLGVAFLVFAVLVPIYNVAQLN